MSWASWKFKLSYLPPAFHAHTGKGSFSDLTSWLTHEPVTTSAKKLASYQTIELVALSIGLAMRDLSAIQFSDNSVLPVQLPTSISAIGIIVASRRKYDNWMGRLVRYLST
jgi:hypothetical protein